MANHKFEIAIGDWSGDGHGHSERFVFAANKPIEDVREAYHRAAKNFPQLSPEKFCDEYEDRRVPAETWEALKAAGCPLPNDQEDGWSPDAMALVVAWFCMQGDADLRIEYTPAEALPSLHFYGCDAKKRHIGFIGYGFFGN